MTDPTSLEKCWTARLRQLSKLCRNFILNADDLDVERCFAPSDIIELHVRSQCLSIETRLSVSGPSAALRSNQSDVTPLTFSSFSCGLAVMFERIRASITAADSPGYTSFGGVVSNGCFALFR